MKGMPLLKGEKKLIPAPDTGDLRKLLAVCSGKDFESVRYNALLRQCAFCGYDGQLAAARAGIDAAHSALVQLRWAGRLRQ